MSALARYIVDAVVLERRSPTCTSSAGARKSQSTSLIGARIYGAIPRHRHARLPRPRMSAN
jgi:hypothetical protein